MITPSTAHHLSAAHGYLDLGMVEEAARETEEIAEEDKANPAVVEVLISIYSRTRKWDLMAAKAAQMVQAHPEEPGWWCHWSYATRRFVSLEEANRILKQAETLHPSNALILFNLGCYASQLGDFETSHAKVSAAIKLDSQFKALALSDPDLKPMRERFGVLGS